jgi:hypothetical protein
VNDLIDRQAAIDYCYQLINVEYQQGSDEMNYVQERVSQTETILHHLEFMPSAQPEQRWIPCSERLPDAEDCPMDCMVTRRSKYVGNYTDMAVAEADGTWTHENWKAITIKGKATCISTRDADIIAWMPLLEPYKGEEE